MFCLIIQTYSIWKADKKRGPFLLAANLINILAASKRQPVNYKIVLFRTQKPVAPFCPFVGATKNFKGVNLLFVPYTVTQVSHKS